jgi:hypothetical protein
VQQTCVVGIGEEFHFSPLRSLVIGKGDDEMLGANQDLLTMQEKLGLLEVSPSFSR